MLNWKEIAKFFSGVAAFHAVAHLALGLSGILPIPWFGFTLTPTVNAISIIASVIISLLLAYYGWIKK